MDEVSRILEAFKAMEVAGQKLAECLREDAALPFEVFTYDGASTSPEAHEAAITSLIRLYHIESPAPDANHTIMFHAGIFCVSQKSIDASVHFNQCKIAFKSTVTELRQSINDSKTRLDKLLEKVHGPVHQRPDELALVLKRSGISRADLTRCYSQVRILPASMRSISWTWATVHSTMKRIFFKQAIIKAKSIPSEETQAIVIKLINAVRDDQLLIEKKSLPPSLRANLVFNEMDNDQMTKVTRKAVTISGVVLCFSDTLPRLQWKEFDDVNNTQRLSRESPFIFDKEPYIKIFNWYRRNVTEDEKGFRDE